MEKAPENHWDRYNKNTESFPPRKLLQEAIGTGGNALDLGAGPLNDTRYLLEKGYDVDVVDSNPSVLDRGKDLDAHIFVSTFDTFEFPIAKYDLINAEYSLPFNPPETFDATFERLVESLKPGGTFVGQFFGTEDSWSSNKKMTFHTKEEVEALFKEFTMSHFEEEKKKAEDVSGNEKFWHVFHVIAVRNG